MNLYDMVVDLKKQIDIVVSYREINIDMKLDRLKQATKDTVELNELFSRVDSWAYDKGLLSANPDKQFMKIVEEVGEVAQAYTRKDYDELRTEIGDVLVTLIIFAEQNDMPIESCLLAAVEKIEGRTGEMRDGVFVKESDL